MARNIIVVVDDQPDMLEEFRVAAESLQLKGIHLEEFDNAQDAAVFITRQKTDILGVITDFWILKDQTSGSTGDPRLDRKPYAITLLEGIPKDLPVMIYTRFRKGDFQASTENNLSKAKSMGFKFLEVSSFNVDTADFMLRTIKKFYDHWRQPLKNLKQD